MNGYYHYQEQGDDYGMHCPYRDTCPMRAQCPYCPYQMEENGWMNPGYYGNMSMNMPMEHSLMGNPEPILCPYQNMPWEEYGYENLYPMANNAIVNKEWEVIITIQKARSIIDSGMLVQKKTLTVLGQTTKCLGTIQHHIHINKRRHKNTRKLSNRYM